MMESNRIWQGLEKELQTDLGWIQGGELALAFDQERMALFEDYQALSREFGLETRALTPTELQHLVPAIRPKFIGALYTPSDGQAEPQKVCPAFQQAAQARGAEFITGCAVETVELQNGAVSAVITEKGEIRTALVVCAAGVWSSRMARRLGIRLPSLWLKGTVAQTAPVPEITPATVWGQASFRQRRDRRLYLALGIEAQHDLMLDSLRFLPAFLPSYRQNRGHVKFKLGRVLIEDLLGGFNDFRYKRTLDPPPNSSEIQRALDYLKAGYTGMKYVRVERSWAGYMDCTPDMLPVIDRLERPRGFVFATGFSGHGFGMGPVVGKLVSELIVDGKTSLDIGALRFGRFTDGSRLEPPKVI